ncbi:MAG: iron ABC transporter permease [Herminiimonas sp.]|nr:iron ABC transporter permease [Herminiimonas sp.]
MPPRALRILAALALLAALAVAAAASCGSSGCLRADNLPAATADVIWQLRYPRALSAFAVGALLALAGALMQVLLSNPLADPYVLGVSGGAAAGAMGMLLATPVLIAAGFGWRSEWSVHLGALIGALAAIGLLFLLARRTLFGIGQTSLLAPGSGGVRLILTGVMIASGFGAVITLMLSIAPDNTLRGMIFWLMGDLENTQLFLPALIVLAIALLWSMRNAPRLNVLLHGDAGAQLLGIKVLPLRAGALCIASLATASAVAVAGSIGFVGLVVPHALRLLIGNDQRILLPGSALAGGAALALADLLARTVAAPLQLPVGVITALVGVPVLLSLLARGRA